jgi:putative serine protease PepD
MSQDNAPYTDGAPAGASERTGDAAAANPYISATPGQVPPSARAWSQDMTNDTGPVDVGPVRSGRSAAERPDQPRVQPRPNPTRADQARPDQAWWEPRPSGAWSSSAWGAAPGAAGANRYAGPTGAYDPAQGRPGHPVGGTATLPPVPAERPAKSRKTSTLVAATTALALIAGFGGGYLGSELSSNSAASADSSLTQLNTSAPVSDRTPAPAGSIQAVASKVLPSTVSVLASSNSSAGEGSGVILTADGLILTNNHVVDGASSIEVRFNDGTTAAATVVGTTATDDLAVIKADGVSGLTPATLGSSANLEVGQPVVAIGSPLGLSATVTSGIVSALNRPVRTGSESGQSQDTVINAVQTDAAINPGNSGGALVDMNGNVIGINSAIASLSSSEGGQAGSIGVGFAIPVDQAKRIAQEIISTGKATHAVLGASVSDAAGQSSQIPTGAQIAKVTAGSGAEAAGLQDGDVITKIGNQAVESADALIAAVRSATPNGTVSVTFVRGGQTQTVDVTLGSATAN